ncbi:hypothetical protein ACJIZ3_011266 [Penstemon smallii]|uniref:Uncharacterized protein n=1 Tax=Penstemon smallii TaxID=265156 RepID=A0ABD3UIN8_9LAMI
MLCKCTYVEVQTRHGFPNIPPSF